MLVCERASRLGVALGADRILIGRGFQIVFSERAMNIVTVIARHQTLIYLVVKRHIEGRLDVCMALKAECRLRGLEQLFLLGGGVNAMAACTPHIRLGMR